MIDVMKSVVFQPRDIEQAIPDPFCILDTYGLTSGDELTAIFKALLQTIYPDIETITFMELAKRTGKNLVITVSNLSQHRTEYCCLDTQPDMNVLTALKMSCAYPLLIAPVLYKENLYVDGCLYCQLPLSYLDADTFSEMTTLGLLYTDRVEPIKNFIGYLQAVIFSPWNQWCKIQIQNSSIKNICQVHLQSAEDPTLQIVSLSMSRSEFDSYIEQGYDAMKQHMASKQTTELLSLPPECSE
jgi:predicted acylesterase/phospholipase RssA